LLNYLSEKTLVIITHSPNTANKMNDQYVMQAGKLIAK
jgi:ABC-type transport system involved in cytochrome bd biosynthesis fused ATPase/permease subunit